MLEAGVFAIFYFALKSSGIFSRPFGFFDVNTDEDLRNTKYN